MIIFSCGCDSVLGVGSSYTQARYEAAAIIISPVDCTCDMAGSYA